MIPGAQARRSVARAAGALILALLVAPAGAGAAVECGDTVTADLKLKKNLVGCTDLGLKLDSAGIELDLNGHKIVGTGQAGSAGLDVDAIGIVVKGPGKVAGFEDGIEIHSGSSDSTVRRFKLRKIDDDGVSVNSTTNNQIKALNIRGAQTGVAIVAADSTLVKKNKIIAPGDAPVSTFGVSVNNSLSEDNVIQGNEIDGNGDANSGVLLNGSSMRTSVVENEIHHAAQNGVLVFDGVSDTLVKDNRLHRNDLDGVDVSDSVTDPTGTKLIKNKANKNGSDGIQIQAISTVKKNTANRNGQWGMLVEAFVFNGGGNKAKHNGQPGQCSGISCD